MSKVGLNILMFSHPKVNSFEVSVLKSILIGSGKDCKQLEASTLHLIWKFASGCENRHKGIFLQAFFFFYFGMCSHDPVISPIGVSLERIPCDKQGVIEDQRTVKLLPNHLSFKNTSLSTSRGSKFNFHRNEAHLNVRIAEFASVHFEALAEAKNSCSNTLAGDGFVLHFSPDSFSLSFPWHC